MTREEAFKTVLVETGDRVVYAILEVKEETVIVTPCVGLQVGEVNGKEYEYPLSELQAVDSFRWM
jgi:hypothetical protein